MYHRNLQVMNKIGMLNTHKQILYLNTDSNLY